MQRETEKIDHKTVEGAFRDIFKTVALSVPSNVIQLLLTKMETVVEAVKHTNEMLRSCQEQYARSQMNNAILLFANAHLRDKSELTASKFNN